jgi:hypothetical protein
MPDVTTLRVAIGDYPHTLPLKRGEIVSPWLKLDFVEVKPLDKAFKPMVREHAYDASEMALVTYLQAKAYNKGSRRGAFRAGADARSHARRARRQAHDLRFPSGCHAEVMTPKSHNGRTVVHPSQALGSISGPHA